MNAEKLQIGDGKPFNHAESTAKLLSWQERAGKSNTCVYFVMLLSASFVASASHTPQDAAPILEPILGEAQERIIQYESTDALADPVVKLKADLASGITTLRFNKQRGYLPALLKALRVPASSQSLVFSKTSSQHDHTSPKTPRAIYFSTDVSVGWTPGSPQIDIAAVSPAKGPIFYTLDQNRIGPPRFSRDASCMQCHLSSKTFNVPGLLVRSVYTDSNGIPLSKVNGFISGHNSPLGRRWAGWYVTGSAEKDTHLGNLFWTDNDNPEPATIPLKSTPTDPASRFESSRYLSPHSDIVALLVLEHQVRMQNLITQARYETEYALAGMRSSTNSDLCRQRIATAGDALLEYMLFRDEAPLKGRVSGTSGFAQEFQSKGPADSRCRSFFQLDLQTRLLRYPCSFLIYSPSFEALPQPMKDYLWLRLHDILTGHDRSDTYATMAASDRVAILGILRDTLPEFAIRCRNRATTARR